MNFHSSSICKSLKLDNHMFIKRGIDFKIVIYVY